MTIRDLREQFASTLIGKRLQSAEIAHQTAPNFIALAVLASDAMSSVAYATKEILIILSTAALTGLTLVGFSGNGISIPIAIGISLLIGIVTISYRQTIFSNPAGGGGYRVPRRHTEFSRLIPLGISVFTVFLRECRASCPLFDPTSTYNDPSCG